jgi:23S rRNA (cytidine1920-2'-O)/16S rRNA (cytidine1409-2'-O)-methyltransferase
VALTALVARVSPALSAPEVTDAIESGRVLVDGACMTNPKARVAATAAVRVLPGADLAGRRKLEWAMSRFGVRGAGAVVLDVGACTGGFTTAWLDAGAARVYAVDVGHGQLLGSLRQEPRVINMERTNVSEARIDELATRVSIDVSYLALGSAVAQLPAVAPTCELLGLVKPMFELRLATIPSDRQTLERARDAAVSAVRRAGWAVLGAEECPVRGGHGAIEFFLHARWAG